MYETIGKIVTFIIGVTIAIAPASIALNVVGAPAWVCITVPVISAFAGFHGIKLAKIAE